MARHNMKRLITVAEFSNALDVKFSLLKDMLKQAKIPYIISNENARSVEPFVLSPSNEAIEIKVYEDSFVKANEIFESIQ